MVFTIISAQMALARVALMGVQQKPACIGCDDGLELIGRVILKWKCESDVDRHYIKHSILPQKILFKFFNGVRLGEFINDDLRK